MKKYLLIALAALALAACEKTPGEEDNTPKDRSIQGYAQKGQFVKGSQVTAFAVGSDLVATGESFPANISDDLGAFSISGKSAAPFLELRAEGYYFNEIEGTVSSSPLYLEAIVKSDDTKANINLMTTAIRPRVKKLIKEGKTYDDAVSQAQSELLSALGFTGSAGNFDEMDITGTSDADGMLLAFACMIQSGRSAAEVTTLIQEVASDLESQGKLSATVFDKVKAKAKDVDPFRVVENLARYYDEKKLSVNNVPGFFKYLDSSLDVPFMIVDHTAFGSWPIDSYPDNGGITAPDEIVSGLDVLATINFTVESDIEGVTITKEHILGPAYHISFQIPANEGMQDRTTRIIFKDASGKVLDQREYKQGSNGQYLVIQYGSNTKSDITIEDSLMGNPFIEGAEVSVNGETFTLAPLEAFGGILGVKVPKAESYIVSYPAGKVSEGGHIARAKTTVNSNQTTFQGMYYYGALAPYNGMEIGQLGQVVMKQCFAVFKIKPHEYVKHIEIRPISDSENFAGTASFVVNEQDLYYYSDLNPAIEFSNVTSHGIVLENPNAADALYCALFPQTLSQGIQIEYTVEVDGNKTTNVVNRSQEINLRAGTLISMTLNPTNVQ